MRKSTSAGLLAAAVMAGGCMIQDADAAVFRYFQSGNWDNIATSADPSGWGLNPNTFSGELPDADDDARINFGGNTVTVNTAVPAVNRVQIGVDESGTLNIDSGGILSAVNGPNPGDFFVGNNNAAATGTLNVNDGGVVNVGRILWVGQSGSTGVLNVEQGGEVNVDLHLWWGIGPATTSTVTIDGVINQLATGNGNLGLGTLDASTPSGGFANVTIGSTGELNLANLGSGSIQDGSLLSIEAGGELTVTLDRVGLVQGLIDDGKIVGVGGDLSVDFDAATDLTTVSVVVPEPSSMLLLAGGGLGMLVRRRR